MFVGIISIIDGFVAIKCASTSTIITCITRITISMIFIIIIMR